MDLNYLYKLASLLDSHGKYVESDVVYDSMIRLAKGGKKYYGNQKTKPKIRFKPMPGARPNPNSPGLVPVQRTLPTPPENLPRSDWGDYLDKEPSFRRTFTPEQIQSRRRTLGLDPQTPSKPAPQQPATPVAAPVETPNARSVRKNPGNPYQPRGEGGRFIKAPSSAYNPDPFGNYSIRDTLSYTDPGPVKQPANTQFRRVSPGQTKLYQIGLQDPSLPRATPAGGASPKPGGPSGYAGPTPKFDPIPENFNPIKAGANAAEYRRLILSQPGLKPEIAARLEMLVSKGYLDPKTGNWTRNFDDLQMSQLERFYRNLNRAQDVASDAASAGSKAGRGGAAAATAAKASQFATKAANNPSTAKIVSALAKASTTLGALKPLLRVLPFLGFAASIPEMMNLVNKINQKGWESIWNDPYDRAKAIGAISNTVSAAVSLAPGPLTPVALALAAIGIGSDVGADVARDAGDAAEGGEFKLFGKTLKQKSQQRKDQEAFEAGISAKNIDPQVQAALSQSKNMLINGAKISDILSDPRMKQTFPWLGTSDAKDAQFRVQITALRKSLRAGNAQESQMQQPSSKQQSTGNMLNKQPYGTQNSYSTQDVEQQGQVRQQPQMPQLNSYNDLLYKAYVDTVQNTNVTLENLKNYRDQIITKINNLAPKYPNINAQLAITALDNRIRKYSAQAKPA